MRSSGLISWRRKLARREFVLAAALLATVLASGCSGTTESARGPDEGSTLSAIFRPDFSAREPRRGASEAGVDSGQMAANSVIFGSDQVGLDRTTTGQTPSANDVRLNFEDADLVEFIDAIMGDLLQLNYAIDPNVGGTVTISTARSLARDDLLDVVEAALRLNGAELVRNGELYQIVESTNAVSSRVDLASAGPGYGLTVIPLRYIAPQTLTQLINGFGTRPGAVKTEATRNILIVLGNSADRRTALETAAAFDVDWMADQSVGILAMRNAKPEAVIPELERIFASNGAGPIQFMAMPRLRAVLAVSQNRTLIERAQAWVGRLDQANPELDEGVQVYRVKYRDATVLAELLGQLFAPGASSGAVDDPALAAADAEPELVEATFSGDALEGEFQVGASPTTFVSAMESAGAPRIQADTANNSVVIYGDLEARRRAIAALSRIDVPQLQVAINITMAEVRLTEQLEYGVQYFVKSNSVGLGDDNGSVGLFNTLANNIARELPGFNFVLGSEASPDIIINALDEITDVQVLSSPSLVVLENEEARFQVGDQIPIVTRTVTSVEDENAPVSNQVEYRDTGIIMRVRPRISEDGVVTMQIDQEISAVTDNAGSLTPIISNRSISSNVSVVDGQTVLLGGLIRDQSQNGKDGIPGLHKLKVVGNLFGSTARSSERTELLILIKPTVIRDGRDAQSVAEELQSRMWSLGPRSIKQ